MPSYSAGSAYLQIFPSLEGFGQRLRAELAKENAEVVVPVKPEVVGDGKVKVDGDTTELEAKIRAVGDQTVEVKLDVDSGAFAAKVHSTIDAALKDLPKARIDGDTTPAEQKIAELRARLAELGDKRVGIDVSAAEAMAEIQRIKADLASIANDKTISIDLRTDAAEALAKLQAVKLEADKLDAKRVNVDVDVDDHGSAAKSSGSIGALMSVGIALGPAIIPVAAAVAAALGAIGTGAVLGIAGLGALKLAFTGIGTAVSALDTDQQSQGQNAAQSAAQQVSSANSVASAQDGVAAAATATADAVRSAGTANVNAAQATASAERGLTDAYIAAGTAGTAAAQAVANAQQAVADATRSAAAAVASAIDSERMAEQQLANAQQQEQIAQENLTAARQAAERQLRSLALSVADGALAERQAQLNIQTSKTALDAVLANPTAPALQREQAQLTYDQAVQQLADIKDRNANLAQDKAAADAKGVEGSTQVVAAQRGVASAVQSVQNAQDAVGKAQAAITEAQRSGAESVAKAEQSLANARAAQAETARSSAEKIQVAEQAVANARAAQAETARAGAESIAKAQQGQVAAARSLQNALAQQAAQAAATTSAVSALQKAMDALSPAGQAFAHFIHDELQPKIKELQTAAQQGMLPGVEAGIRATFPLWPQLVGLVGSVSQAMGDMARRTGEALNSQFWRDFLTFIQGEFGPSLRMFGDTIGNLATGFAAMLEAFKPIWDGMGTGLQGLSAHFAAFWKSAAAGNSEPFNKFMEYAKEVLPLVGHFLGDLVTLLSHLGQALAPLGLGLLVVVDGFVRLINAIPISVLTPIVATMWGLYTAVKAYQLLKAGYTGILDFYKDLRKAILWVRDAHILANIAKAAGVVWDGIAATATGIWTAAQWLLNIALSANPIGLIILGIAALVAIIILVAKNWDFFKGIVLVCLDAIKTAWQAVWDNFLKPGFDMFVAGLRDIGGVFLWLWHNIAEPAWNGLGAIIKLVWDNVIKPVWDALVAAVHAIGDAVMWLWHTIVEPAWNGIGAAAQAVWNNVLKPAWDALVIAVHAIGDACTWLWHNIIEPAWNGIGAACQAVYDNVIKPVFDAMSTGVRAVGDAFKASADFIGGVWDGLKRLVAVPVNFIIEQVWNRIVPLWGGKPVASIAFATGGKVPGSGHGDTVPAMLTPGEFVVRKTIAEPTRNFLEALNAGQSEALQAAGGTNGRMQYFDAGGQVLKAQQWAQQQHGKPYIWGGVGPAGFDCSGFMSAITNVLRNQPPNSRLGVAESQPWSGFKSGLGGAFATGFSQVHTAGTLGGVNVEAGGSPSMTKYGAGAAGADSSQFAGHAYLPEVGGAFASGGLAGAFQSAMAWVTETLAKVSNIFRSIADPFIAAMPSGPPIIKGMPKDLLRFAVDKMFGAANAAVQAAAPSTGGAGGGAGTEQWRAIGLQALSIAGQSAGDIGKLLMQMGTESSGNPGAINKTDINWQNGTPSVGLMQVIGPTYAKWHHPAYNAGPFEYNVSEDPLSNILASIRYTVANYGSLAAGWQGHGYDQGGWLPPGLSLAQNNTGQPERVLTGAQWSAVSKATEGGGQPITVHVHPRAEHNEADVADMVSRRLAFAMRTGA